ncbi:protein kilB [Streptomyces anulatus]|uniref:protein kilB n=1 Tax=Streptomyces anulatus TaxID=1892 RepID=UPI002E1521E6|nr:protein kilB [Streptomyces anulatus]
MLTTLIAVLGTLAGVAITSGYQARAARMARQETRRTEGIAAVEILAAALADHRLAMWVREDLRLRGEDWSAARTESHTTRSAVTAPLIRVQILLPAAADLARNAAQAAYALRNAADAAALAEARENAIRKADEFVTAAGTALAT